MFLLGLLVARPVRSLVPRGRRVAARFVPARRRMRRSAGSASTLAAPFGTVALTCGGPNSTVGAEELSEMLMELGAMSVESTDADAGTVEEEPILSSSSRREWDPSTTRWRRARVTALVELGDEGRILEGLRVVFGAAEVAALEPSCAELEDRDWLEEQELLRPPIHLGDLRIRLPWHAPDPEAKYELSVEGGAAFGTGEHPTTRVCCEWLLDKAHQHHDLEGKRVLDYGCGSGILALAAVTFGAASAVGVDIDGVAVATAKRNAAMNCLDGAVDFYLPPDTGSAGSARSAGSAEARMASALKPSASAESPLPLNLAPFPVVVANILLNPLLALRDTILDCVAAGGDLAISGVRANQAEAVLEAYSPAFEQAHIARNLDDWLLLEFTARRPPTAA